MFDHSASLRYHSNSFSQIIDFYASCYFRTYKIICIFARNIFHRIFRFKTEIQLSPKTNKYINICLLLQKKFKLKV